MNKIYVILYVPLIAEKYEIMIPVSKKLNCILSLLVKSVNELSGGSYPLDRNNLLYKKKNGQPYDLNITVKESDIRNGSEIILV
jgi:hypothetical protein